MPNHKSLNLQNFAETPSLFFIPERTLFGHPVPFFLPVSTGNSKNLNSRLAKGNESRKETVVGISERKNRVHLLTGKCPVSPALGAKTKGHNIINGKGPYGEATHFRACSFIFCQGHLVRGRSQAERVLISPSPISSIVLSMMPKTSFPKSLEDRIGKIKHLSLEDPPTLLQGV